MQSNSNIGLSLAIKSKYIISESMGKRRNLKRRDNEAEDAGSGSDVALSAIENEHDSADESDKGAREEVVTRRKNVDFELPNVHRELEREGIETDQANGVETDNDESTSPWALIIMDKVKSRGLNSKSLMTCKGMEIATFLKAW